jgi:hypothetical protein
MSVGVDETAIVSTQLLQPQQQLTQIPEDTLVPSILPQQRGCGVTGQDLMRRQDKRCDEDKSLYRKTLIMRVTALRYPKEPELYLACAFKHGIVPISPI